ncbi:hypothetical protein GCM10027020_12600 [Nocardioides salsibiostraticola]
MSTEPVFATTEGLRLLLVRLQYSGPRGWEDDSEASALMTFAMRKYAALAHKHGLEPSDAAVAAFDVMRTRAARVADDPWAVVTRAVQLSLIYEARAQGLLCSPHQARRAALATCHDAERFSDRETELAEYHPAFRVEDDLKEIDGPALVGTEEPTNAYVALDAAVVLFVELGWPESAARIGLEYICSRVMRSGDRPAAYEALRRDQNLRAQLELDQESWLDVLRVVLGNPGPDYTGTAAGRGILLRLLIGHRVDELFGDIDVADAIEKAATQVVGGSHV